MNNKSINYFISSLLNDDVLRKEFTKDFDEITHIMTKLLLYFCIHTQSYSNIAEQWQKSGKEDKYTVEMIREYILLGFIQNNLDILKDKMKEFESGGEGFSLSVFKLFDEKFVNKSNIPTKEELEYAEAMIMDAAKDNWKYGENPNV